MNTIETLDQNILEAFRTAWRAVVKCATAASDISVDAATGDYLRGSGSWIDDGYDLGDEVTAGGFPDAGNNGASVVQFVTDARLSVDRPWTNADALVTAAAGPAVTLTVGVPAFVKYDGWLKSPASARPWFREDYQPIAVDPASLRSPTAKVRQQGIYWLTVYYPANHGGIGASRLRGKIMALIYPAADLTYGGQLVRVQTHALKKVEEGPEWVGYKVGFVHIADALNPS